MLTSKQRKVEASIFQHPSFRRASYVARELYLGLIIAVADDEGRFLAEPFHLLEQCFSRSHDATEQEIMEALNWWAAEGIIIVYDGYGFLSGWFEHQYIDKRVREESAFPEPPGNGIRSWAQADAIAVQYREATGKERVTVRDATRWHKQLPEATGKHRKSRENNSSRPRTPAPAPTPAPTPAPGGDAPAGADATPSTAFGRKRPDGPMLLMNYCRLADAVREAYGQNWQQFKQNDFVADAGAALDEPGCTVTEDEAIASILGSGKPEPGRRGDWWVGDLCKAKRNGMGSTGDPVLDAFIKHEGKKRPDDIWGAAEWDEHLTLFRAAQEVPA